jgi:hypothetical protein
MHTLVILVEIQELLFLIYMKQELTHVNVHQITC